MMRDEVLSPCPFCSESEHVREKCGSDVFYACTNCGAGGPLGSTEEAAAVAWNNAHLPPANIGADSPSAREKALREAILALGNTKQRWVRRSDVLALLATPAEGGSDG